MAYKSKFEQEFANHLQATNRDVCYEEDKLPYIVPAKKRTYTPDFKISTDVYVETKGILSKDDRMKLILIKEQYPHIRIVLVFMNWNNKIYKKSKTSYQQWAVENGFECFNKVLPRNFK